jgi:hypothetical protein
MPSFPLHLAQSLKQILLDPTSTIDKAKRPVIRLGIPQDFVLLLRYLLKRLVDW